MRWKLRVDFSSEFERFSKNEISLDDVIKSVINKLKRLKFSKELRPHMISLGYIVEHFESLLDNENRTVYQFHSILDELYGWADQRIDNDVCFWLCRVKTS